MSINATFNLRDVPPTLWANGAGVTRELLREPADSELSNMVFRVSIANVDASGPFSILPGITRSLLLLRGSGLQLRFADGVTHDLTMPFVPFDFCGDHAVSAEVLGTETQDFNLMVRKDQAQGKVVVHKGLGKVSLAQNVVLLYVARGSALVQYPNNSSHQMRAADYLRLTSFPTPINLECDAGSVVLAVHIDRFQT